MNRKILATPTAACTLILAGCSARTELTGEERVERPSKEAQLAEEQQLERNVAARTQLQYEGRQASSDSRP